jgi:hypothetical protein
MYCPENASVRADHKKLRPYSAERPSRANGVTVKSIAFGRVGEWETLVQDTIDLDSYRVACVDFWEFDLDRVDYAIPLKFWDCDVLRSRYGDWNAKYILPDAGVIALCADKKAFNEAILGSDYGWMIPPIRDGAAPAFPYILKKRDEDSGVETFVVRDLADEAPHAARLGTDEYFCQSYVPGKIEYATHMLILDGHVFYHSTNSYEMADEFLVKGSAMQPIDEVIGADMAPCIIEHLTKMLRMIGFNGACCVDYKIVDGRIRLLEVNPRVGFSLFRDINRFLLAYENALQAQRI